MLMEWNLSKTPSAAESSVTRLQGWSKVILPMIHGLKQETEWCAAFLCDGVCSKHVLFCEIRAFRWSSCSSFRQPPLLVVPPTANSPTHVLWNCFYRHVKLSLERLRHLLCRKACDGTDAVAGEHVWIGRVADVSPWCWRLDFSITPGLYSVQHLRVIFKAVYLHSSSPHRRLHSASVSACEAPFFLTILSFLSIAWTFSSRPWWN